MVWALSPRTISAPSPAITTATSCPTSTDPFTAMWSGIEARVGSPTPAVTKYTNFIPITSFPGGLQHLRQRFVHGHGKVLDVRQRVPVGSEPERHGPRQARARDRQGHVLRDRHDRV